MGLKNMHGKIIGMIMCMLMITSVFGSITVLATDPSGSATWREITSVFGSNTYISYGPPGYIDGYVTNKNTGQPIQGASVVCNVDSDITDSNGFYHLVIDIPPNCNDVTYSKDGYISETHNICVAAQQTTPWDVALVPDPENSPPTVSTNGASGITSTTATLNGNLIDMGRASSCEVWFEWGTTTSYGYETTHQTKITTGTFSADISGLSTSTTYHFRAVASNSAGTNRGDTKQFTTTKESNPNDTPLWAVGNYWIYDFKFEFKYLVIDMKGVISNMKLNVTEVNEEKNEYKLKISGTITADLSLFGIISGGSYNGDIDGEACIDRSTLALKDFNIESYGHYNTIVTVDTFTTVTMTFNPAFDFFGFPIEPKEDESNPWSAETYADINGDFKLGIIDYPFNVNGDFKGEKLHFIRVEDHTVNGVTFDCILFSGSMGPTHEGSSNLWYSSDVGYLVDIQETIYDWEGVNAKLNMQLKYTNFKSDNTPPYKPVEPTGETELTTGEQYTYKTSTTDKENNNIYYKFNWGDETESEWLGPYASGSEVTASHVWDKTGSCSIRAKAKDTNDVESPWSDPLSVNVISNMPTTTVCLYKITNENMDDIDYSYPWDLGAVTPEWYYRVEAISNIDTPYEKVATTSLIFNKDSHGQWVHEKTWTPNTKHELLSYGPKVVITIKLMDYDEWWEGGDDLADVSGCRGDGKDNDISDNNRGAIYHAAYNLATNNLNENGYSENPADYADYYEIQDGLYFIAGDQKPDNSVNYDGNDAGVWFTISDSYEPPEAGIVDLPQTAITGEEIRFIGKVTDGIPPYSYYWDFGDGSTSNEQNPIHVYNTAGTYAITLTVTDAFSQSDSYETTINIIANQPPNKPSRPSGQTEGKLGQEYSYTTSTTDPEGNKISYLFDWGDGTDSGWIGPYNSGESVSVSHTWATKGSYSVKVKAKDVHDAESAWSDPLPVKMPLSGTSSLTKVTGVIPTCISNIKISTTQPESNPSAQQSSSSTTVSAATVTTISATTRQTSTIR